MRRGLVALAIRSGIPVDTWLAGDPRDLDTALDLLREAAEHEHER